MDNVDNQVYVAWEGVPKIFWVEAANTVVLGRIDLQRKLRRIKHHLKLGTSLSLHWVFLKCLVECFVHVPHIKRDKLDKKSIIGIYVGYNTVSKAYKVYHPKQERWQLQEIVHFSENEFSEIRRMTSGTGAVEALQEPK